LCRKLERKKDAKNSECTAVDINHGLKLNSFSKDLLKLYR